MQIHSRSNDMTMADGPFETSVTHGMRIEWDVPFTMADGTVIRADVFRPLSEDPVGTIVSTSIYGKGLRFQDWFPAQWAALSSEYPEAVAGSSNDFQNWEVVDPERWVPDGFAVVRIDARGSGTSEGFLNPFHDQEAQDAAEVIGRIASQSWSNGRIGMVGISYHAVMGWKVAALNPPALAAMAAWEGCCDFYRDAVYHGGIYSQMPERWFPNQVLRVQHGSGTPRNPSTGRSVTGDVALEEKLLAAARYPFVEELRRHRLAGAFYEERSAKVEDIRCAVLSAGNWGGLGLHLRGNVEGFIRAGTKDKYLEMHGREHWTDFCTPYGEDMLKRFFSYYLHDHKSGWQEQPRVLLNIRHADGRLEPRGEGEWPLARTHWTRLYLDPERMMLAQEPYAGEAILRYEPLKDNGLTFETEPFAAPVELTGPAVAKLFVSSDSDDADIFVVLKLLDTAGREVRFNGAVDPNTPLSQGWLRASHRRTDPARSLPYRPWHSHDAAQPLTPGEVAALEVEIWPTCIVLPAGYRIAVTVRGRDYDCTEEDTVSLREYAGSVLTGMRGCGPFTHADAEDRPEKTFGATVTLHFGADRQPYLLLPVIP